MLILMSMWLRYLDILEKGIYKGSYKHFKKRDSDVDP